MDEISRTMEVMENPPISATVTDESGSVTTVTSTGEELSKCVRLIEHYNTKLFTPIVKEYNRKKPMRHRIAEFEARFITEKATDPTEEDLLFVELCTATSRLATGSCFANERNLKELMRGFMVKMCTHGIRWMVNNAVKLDEDAI